MNRVRIAQSIATVVALAGCSHPGAPVAPPPEPVPASLDVAVTDAPDSVAGWLGRSGAYLAPEHEGDTLRVEPAVSRAGPALLLHRVAPRDARDAIDAGVDVVVTGDPAAVAYASTRADLISVPTQWNRTYALLAPGSAGSAAASPLLDTLREELAAGAVRVEARAAPDSGASSDSCAGSDTTRSAAAAPAGARPRIVFSRADEAAGALAARLVALGASRGRLLAALSPGLAAAGDSLRAEGVEGQDLWSAIGDGRAAAAVVALPPAGACAVAVSPGRPRVGIVPLVQTRERLIARRSLTDAALATLRRAMGDSSAVGP